MQWSKALLVCSITVNCIAGVSLLKNDIAKNSDSSSTQVTSNDLENSLTENSDSLSKNRSIELDSTREIKDLLYIMSDQIQDLNYRIDSIQAQNKVELADQNNHTQSNNTGNSKEHQISPVELERQQLANKNAHAMVDTVLADGHLDLETSLDLKSAMSEMSPEDHYKAIQRLVIAVNNENLELQPDALF